jgi:hypothetical protein
LLPSRTSRRAIAAVSSALIVAGTAGTATASGHPDPAAQRLIAATGASASEIGYAVDKALCGTTVRRGYANCFALKREPVKKGTAGALPYLKRVPSTTRPAAVTLGPATGYTPADLAAAYGFNPDARRANQLVAVIDWYDDPHVRHDLNIFDAHYGLPTETAASFRVVNQNGKVSPLPSSTAGVHTAGEISLDVEAVRAVCHSCRIVLVEAKNGRIDHLAAAENTAAALGATEITNSWGSPEFPDFPKVLKDAFNQPGVVITASTGDDGWFDWDLSNDGKNPFPSSNAPEFPSSSPNVVSVGGTSLHLNPVDGSIDTQAVWNNNGPSDTVGVNGGGGFHPGPEGASGGGCSTLFGAPAWQKSFAGYAAAGCNGKRLAADVSMLGDPQTGFDTYDTWGTGDTGWLTVGGTSLSAPIIAAMYALAGGSGGAAYPAASLYLNATRHPIDEFDVIDGGNSFCGGDSPANCELAAAAVSHGGTNNPNNLLVGSLHLGNLDCSFPRIRAGVLAPPVISSECNAVAGYDGASGIGTPVSGALLAATNPKISITRPRTLRLRKPASFTIHDTTRIAGTHISGTLVDWGDGKESTGIALTKSHVYRKPGRYFVIAVVEDNLHQESIAFTSVTVGKKLLAKVLGPKRSTAGHKARFRVRATDLNTGGKVTKITWRWGDGHRASGKRVSHVRHRPGRYKIKLTLRDNTGVKTTYIRHETVK